MITRQNAIVDKRTGKIIVQTLPPPINCLAFEGGGSRCAAYPGVYKVLSKYGLMEDVRYLSGTSGGAICALAIALGYNPEEVETILLDLNMERFLEGNHAGLNSTGYFASGRTLWSILTSNKFGLSSGNDFLKWLEEIVEAKLGSKQATFADLAAVAADKHSTFKYLYVTGVNLSLAIPECKFFSHETAPDMPLALAVRISSSFPGVFENVLWNGYLWGDGGLMWNLPTKVFDDKRYLPEGYDFTEKGINPGVLAIKVDTLDEINQVIWGVAKEANLESASELGAQLYTALAQNTDIEEIREARMTIALPDNNIGVLEFAVNDEGKISLISNAEFETQNFIENYFNGAYDVKVYPSTLSWLASLSIDDIDDLLLVYERRLEDGEGKQKEKNNDDMAYTFKELQAYCEFLRNYMRFRRQQKRQPDTEFTLDVPPHINIKPLCRANDWNERVETEMKDKLRHICDQEAYAASRIYSLECEFFDLHEMMPWMRLHDEHYFENIQALTTLLEYERILAEEKKALEIKLGVTHDDPPYYTEENSKAYAAFLVELNPYINKRANAPELQALLVDNFPIFKYQSCGYGKRTLFMLDLYDEFDRSLYITAVLLYLDYHQIASKKVFMDLYQRFVSAEAVLPKNLAMLATVLKVNGVDLLVAAYKMEELLHHFEKIVNPKVAPSLNLDTMFGLVQIKQVRPGDSNAVKLLNMSPLVPTSNLATPPSFPNPDEEKRSIALKHLIQTNFMFSSSVCSSLKAGASSTSSTSPYDSVINHLPTTSLFAQGLAARGQNDEELPRNAFHHS